MKKLLALILIVASLLSFAACKKDEDEKYPPIESTEEEAKVIMTLKIDNAEYGIRYELYRALFLNFSGEYDNGDKNFWDSQTSASALEALNAKIIDYAADIFAVIHLSKKIGYDPYSKDADELVYKYIKDSVEGNGGSVLGHGGDYDAYLAALKAQNLNYSVQTLLYRYSIAYDKLIEHYIGTIDSENPTEDMTEGAIKYTRDDVLAFYNSENSARVSLVTLNSGYVSRARATEIRNSIAACATTEEALNKAISLTSADPRDVYNGALIGRYSLDSAYHSEVMDAALSLDISETSELLEVSSDFCNEYWILYKLEKNDTHFNDCYSSIASVYVSNKFGEIIESNKSTLKNSCVKTENYNTIVHSGISMQ